MKKAVLLKLFLLVFSATLGLTSAWAVQPQINYQGLLNDSTGAPVNDPNVTMIFRLWNDATSILTSNKLWEETQTVDVGNGVYNVLLGSVTPLPDGVTIGAENLWLEVTVNGDTLSPRVTVSSVPSSLWSTEAGNASTLDGQLASDIIAAASDEVRTPISSIPVEIIASGSYYLTDNLSTTGIPSPADIATTAITVSADDVTLDLMGFTISGPGTGTGTGIYVNGHANVEIKNGTVRAFGANGIAAPTTFSKGIRIINMRVLDNGAVGIEIKDGESHLIKDCVVSNNLSYGIQTGNGCTVSGNTSSNNGSHGIYSDSTSGNNGSTVINNTVHSNGGSGIEGYTNSTITGNTVYADQQHGINVTACLIDQNSAVNNNQSGGAFVNINNPAANTIGTNHAP